MPRPWQRNFPYFARLGSGTVRTLVRRAEEVAYKKGGAIASEGAGQPQATGVILTRPCIFHGRLSV